MAKYMSIVLMAFFLMHKSCSASTTVVATQSLTQLPGSSTATATAGISPTATATATQAVTSTVAMGSWTAWNTTCKEGGCCDVSLGTKVYTQHRSCSGGGTNCPADADGTKNLTKTTTCPANTADCSLCPKAGAGAVKPVILPMLISMIMAMLAYAFM